MTSPSDSERQEAGPLPRKLGEIGFIEGVHVQHNLQPPPTPVVLSPRHPADRDVDLEAQMTSPTTNIPITPAIRETNTANAPATPNAASKKANCLPTIGGIHLTTLSIFVLQILLFGGTIAGWVLSIRAVNHNSNSGLALGGPPLAVFLHVVFSVSILVELIFFERSVFRARAERYAYLHPGEILPSARIRGRLPSPIIAFAPWNRPPVPTYAAALAQSGVGTGDVEDHLIAAPPPPAYGQTRGSRLLLAGHMRDSLRAQRPDSADSALSYIDAVPPGEPDPAHFSYEQFVQALREGQTPRRLDEVAEDDADRDRRRDETLAQLQNSALPSASDDHRQR